jgi:hypothetical protein
MRTTLNVERLEPRDTTALFFLPVGSSFVPVIAPAITAATPNFSIAPRPITPQSLFTPQSLVTPPTISLTTMNFSFALPAQPFLLTPVPTAPGMPQVFMLQTAGMHFTFTGPFVFTSPLFNFAVGPPTVGITPMTAAAHPMFPTIFG